MCDFFSQLTPMWNSIDRRAMERELNPDQQAFSIDDYNTLDDVRI
jgi:hypothetical protein